MPFLPSSHRRWSGCLPTFHSAMKSSSSLRPDRKMSTLQKSKWQLRCGRGRCVWQVWERQAACGSGEEKPRRPGCVSHSPGDAIHTALPVSGVQGGCKVRRLHSSPARRGPFPYLGCKTKPKVAWTLEGGKGMVWLRGSPGLTVAVSLAGRHRLKKPAKATQTFRNPAVTWFTKWGR